jgi:dihydrolipoamide dehydrogenase
MAALHARELGATVALVERGRLGGTCTNDGCVPTRVLAHAARLVREAEQFSDYGVVGSKPAIDFARLMARVQHVVYKMHEKKQVADHLIRAGASVLMDAGAARFVDEHTLELGDGTHLQGDKIIICAGGHARQSSFPGSEYALTHHDIWSLNKLPRSIAVVGAAATGCQFASILATLGAKVWLLNHGSRILRIEDQLVSQAISEAFRKRGIEVMAGIGEVEHIEKRDGHLRLHHTQDPTRPIEVEAVVIAVGWDANAEALNLATANVKTEHGHILVDDYQRTSTPHIFAAGDITGRMMLVQSAGYEGRIAAENAVLGPGLPYKHQIVPHGGFTDPEYGSVGLTEEQARAQGDCAVAVVPYADLDRAVIDGHTTGSCKLIVSVETHRILGAHIVGEQALEAIQIVAAGMAADMWVEQLAELELAYPTYTAIVGLAARQLMRELGVMPLAPQWLALGKLRAAEWEQSEER